MIHDNSSSSLFKSNDLNLTAPISSTLATKKQDNTNSYSYSDNNLRTYTPQLGTADSKTSHVSKVNKLMLFNTCFKSN